MLKLLPALFFICTFQSFAQYGMKEPTLSRKTDPELLWFQKDSLQLVDTLKTGIDLAEYYELNYDIDQTLYWYDRKEKHVSNCLNWTKGWSFHDPSSIEPLICGLEMCRRLENDSVGKIYYNRILQKFNEKNWTEDEKRRINHAASALKLNSFQLEGGWDFEYDLYEVACAIDTLAKIRPQTEVNATRERGKDYELTVGWNNYLELKISTRDCRCRDCSYATKIFIKMSGEELPVSLELDSMNCFLSTTNNWIYEPKRPISFGKLFRSKQGLYLILAYKQNPDDNLYLLERYWIAPENLEEL